MTRFINCEVCQTECPSCKQMYENGGQCAAPVMRGGCPDGESLKLKIITLISQISQREIDPEARERLIKDLQSIWRATPSTPAQSDEGEKLQWQADKIAELDDERQRLLAELSRLRLAQSEAGK